MNDVDISYYVKEIRKHAAIYQCGGVLSEAKLSVDGLIQNIRDSLGSNREHQAQIWSHLLNMLNLYNTNMADPKWLEVITHAKNRVKTRRNSIIYYKSSF